MQRTFQKGQGTGGRPGPEPLPEAHIFLPEAALTQTRHVYLSGLGVGVLVVLGGLGGGPQLPPQRLPAAQKTQNTPSLPGD